MYISLTPKMKIINTLASYVVRDKVGSVDSPLSNKQHSQNSVWETALIKMGNLDAETLIIADRCRVMSLINVVLFIFKRTDLVRDILRQSA